MQSATAPQIPLHERTAAIRQQAKLQKRNAQIVRILVVLFMIVSVLSCLVMLPFLTLMIGPGLFNETPAYFFWIILLLVYSAFFILPFLFCLPVILPFSIRHKNINRIVVFRKFNSDVSKAALRRLSRSVLGNYGHVFTLSDKNFKIPWYVHIPVVLGQMSFFHFRQQTIKKANDLDKLRKTLGNRGWLNINWFLSSSKIFAVKTTDEWWQEAALILLRECDLIIFDVSTFTEALEWETNTTKKLNLESKIIVVANEANRETALEWKLKYDNPDDDYDIPLFFYDSESELTDVAALEEGIATVLAAIQGGVPVKYTTGILKKTAYTSAAMVLVFGVVLFLVSPFVMPGLAGRLTPFPRQVVQSYIQLHLQDMPDSADAAAIRQRAKNTWPQKVAALAVDYAYHHQAAECEGVAAAVSHLAHASVIADYLQLVEKGEPLMADTAFAALTTMPGSGGGDFEPAGLALRLLGNKRLDVKEKGLRLLQTKPVAAVTILRVIEELSKPGYVALMPPFQHKPKNGLDFSGFFKSEKSFEERLLLFYSGLFDLLNTNGLEVPVSRLEVAYRQAASEEARMVLAILLLHRKNAVGLRSILRPSFLNLFYKEKKTALFSRPAMVLSGLGLAVDSMLGGPERLANMPSYNEISRLRSPSPIYTSLSATALQFLLRNYPVSVLTELKSFIDAQTLASLLRRYMPQANAADFRTGISIVRDRSAELTAFMQNSENETEERLDAAWLLAHTGTMAAAVTALEASKEESTGLFSRSRPYESEAKVILQRLLTTIPQPFDQAPLLKASQGLSPEIQVIFDKLVRKAGRN